MIKAEKWKQWHILWTHFQRGRGVTMEKYIRYAIGVVVVGYVVACAPVKFEKQIPCGAGCTGVTPSGDIQYDVTTTVGGGKVDILIVDDNSASMSPEQHAMAARFSNFISALDARSIDYRIAIITADVSATAGNGPRTINGNGALQDGNLITFADSSKFLTPSTLNKTTLFATAIERNETIQCENYLIANPSAPNYSTYCPSPDERGIYAANLVVQNNPSGFIRSDAALALVVLSDEDVRSSVYTSYDSYALEALDMPQTLMSNVQSRYTGKSFAVHTITVKPGTLLNGVTPQDAASRIFSAFGVGGNESASSAPSALFGTGDSSCLNTQSSQINNVRGSYGYMYALAARMTNGYEGTICASDYSSQLTAIGNQIGQQVNSIGLNCSNPFDLIVTFVSGPSVSWSQVGASINFASTLTPGTQVRVQYKCHFVN